jgi:integrase
MAGLLQIERMIVMTATLITRKDQSNYIALIRYKDDAGVKRSTSKSTGVPIKGNNKRRAEARLKEILAEFEVEQGETDISKNVLFTVFIKEWLEFLKPSVEAVTYDSYRMIIYNQIAPFYEPLKLKVTEVTPLHIQQYVNFRLKRVSPNTVRKHLWNLSKCFDSAIKQNLITFNPVKGIDKPKKVKYTGAQFYNERQIDSLLSAVKGDIIEGVILFATFYGMRRSEIIGLRWSAFNFDNNTFMVNHTVVRIDKELHKKDSTKTDSSYRSLPMPDVIVEMLKKLKTKQEEFKVLQPNDYVVSDYVFTHADGRLLSPNFVSKHFKDVLIKNSLPVIRLHDLRHSAASYLLYLGFSMKEIQIWLGHGDIGTTMNLYTHLDMTAKRNIADTLNVKFRSFGS